MLTQSTVYTVQSPPRWAGHGESSQRTAFCGSRSARGRVTIRTPACRTPPAGRARCETAGTRPKLCAPTGRWARKSPKFNTCTGVCLVKLVHNLPHSTSVFPVLTVIYIQCNKHHSKWEFNIMAMMGKFSSGLNWKKKQQQILLVLKANLLFSIV